MTKDNKFAEEFRASNNLDIDYLFLVSHRFQRRGIMPENGSIGQAKNAVPFNEWHMSQCPAQDQHERNAPWSLRWKTGFGQNDAACNSTS
jgi:hypothetical protein